MPNPIDATTNLPISLPHIALPINEVNIDHNGDGEPTNAEAQNFSEEANSNDWNFDNYYGFVFCADANSGAPPPAALLTFPTNNINKTMGLYILINQWKCSTKANPSASDLDIMTYIYNYYYWLGNCGNCNNLLGSRKVNCNCLSILATNLDVKEAFTKHVFHWVLNPYSERQVPFILWYQMIHATTV